MIVRIRRRGGSTRSGGTILASAGMSAGSSLLFGPTLGVQSGLHRSGRFGGLTPASIYLILAAVQGFPRIMEMGWSPEFLDPRNTRIVG